MRVSTGIVRPDGSSAIELPGVYDMAALGENAKVDERVEERLNELYKQADLARTSDAKFKLEVFFAGGPRRNVPVRGVMAAWTNGGFLNGNGDLTVYFCPLRDPNHADRYCLNPIDVQFAAAVARKDVTDLRPAERVVVCQKCMRIVNVKELVGQIIVDTTTQHWASTLLRFFHLLGCNADLRICVERNSIRTASEKELERARGGEVYERVYRAREWMTYPLRHIIADTASGATLESRIKVFLES